MKIFTRKNYFKYYLIYAEFIVSFFCHFSKQLFIKFNFIFNFQKINISQKFFIDNGSILLYNSVMNIEVYNYLNLINFNLAKLYRSGLYKPFSDNFEVTKEKIKERLILSQIKIKLPDFVFDEKKKIKEKIKNSQKNIKKLIKNLKNIDFSRIFAEKIEIYLKFRQKISALLLRNFKHQDFDENDAIEQILKIDPIFSELLCSLFEKDFDADLVFEGLENRYISLYNKKIKLIEKKNNQKSRRQSIVLANESIDKNLKSKTTRKELATDKLMIKKQKASNKQAVRQTKKIKITSEIKEL